MFNIGSITLWYVLAGTIIASVSIATIGTFVLLQKKPLAGDALAHALLPGLCLGFLWTGYKSSISISTGAFLFGMFAFYLLDKIPQWSKLNSDTATALILALFFGFGLLLLTYIQHSGNAQQVGLQHFLFGNAASVQRKDLILFTSIALALLLLLKSVYRALNVWIFDEAFTATLGWPIYGISTLFRIFVVTAVIVGMHSIGVVLMTAMLIAPGAAARFWTDRLPPILGIASLFAAISATTGTLLSFHVDRLPTGPCIVLTMSLIAFLSFLIAPKKGFFSRKKSLYTYKKKVQRENLLKHLYTLEKENPDKKHFSWQEITPQAPIDPHKLAHAMKKLARQKLVSQEKKDLWHLTDTGRAIGKKILHLHLLWETYLIKYIHIAPDHVHEDAESIEHLLTPQLQQELEKLIGDVPS